MERSHTQAAGPAAQDAAQSAPRAAAKAALELARPFGTLKDGGSAHIWRLKSTSGLVAQVTDLGACLQSLVVPDNGGGTDVVLGYDDANGYEQDRAHMGAVIGRVANRTGKAAFTLSGHTYHLAKNEGENNNHSGPDLWRYRLWTPVYADEQNLTLELVSAEGDQGFPGQVTARVSYSVEGLTLTIHYEATATADTPINLTNHSYFNLNGQSSGSALGHVVEVHAARVCEVDGGNVPTGVMLEVQDTPLDLQEPHPLSQGFSRERYGEAAFSLVGNDGYDHNYETLGFCAETGRVGRVREVAWAEGDQSHISMSVATDMPGVQLYTANYLDGCAGKGGRAMQAHDAVCFETQFFPDAPNHPEFVQNIFGPGRPFVSDTSFTFASAK
ncbi:MAG: aldose epimerase family protein [Atopobiaceae bacterium]|jgi:aldose 1-epimerase